MHSASGQLCTTRHAALVFSNHEHFPRTRCLQKKENSFQTHKHSSEFSSRYLVDHRREPEGKEHDGGVAGNGVVPQTVQSGKQYRSRLCRYQDAIILAAKGDNKSYTSATFSSWDSEYRTNPGIPRFQVNLHSIPIEKFALNF